jgi:dienelactone hydrolase
MKRFILPLLALLAIPSMLQAAIHTAAVDYKAGDMAMRGLIAYDDAVQGARPAVLVMPEWWGLTDYPKQRAVDLAKLGYVAFAADMYGDGKTTNDPKEAGALSSAAKKDPAQFVARAKAGLEAMKSEAKKAGMLDESKIAVIGYCFGGAAALDLARSGAAIAGVVAFHGDLSTATPATEGTVKAKVLVCTGADDPMVRPDSVTAFSNEMKRANVDYQIILYGGAVHAFTNPNADKFKIPGIAYNENADKRSWAAMKTFFDELFNDTNDRQYTRVDDP